MTPLDQIPAHLSRKPIFIVTILLGLSITIFIASLFLLQTKDSAKISVSTPTSLPVSQTPTPTVKTTNMTLLANDWKEYKVPEKRTTNKENPWAGFTLGYPPTWKILVVDDQEGGAVIHLYKDINSNKNIYNTYIDISRPYESERLVFGSCSFEDIHPPNLPNEFDNYTEQVKTNVPTLYSANGQEKWRIAHVSDKSYALHKVCAYSPELKLYTNLTALGKIEFGNFADDASATAEFLQIVQSIRFTP